MSDLAIPVAHLPAMTPEAIGRVRQAESRILAAPQAPLCTAHLIHAGVYYRTIMVPAGHCMTGVLIKIPTTVIVSGHTYVHTGDASLTLQGHNVLPASAHRKQLFVTVSDTYITMAFATQATTVEQAEAEFTDEAHLLVSRRDQNTVVITGD